MQGDSLAVFLFFASVAVSGVLAATAAPRGLGRWVSWACAAIGLFAVAMLLTKPTDLTLPFDQIWKIATAVTPLIAVVLVRAIVSRDQVEPVEILPEESSTTEEPSIVSAVISAVASLGEPETPSQKKQLLEPNPKLTAAFLNDLVAGKTGLEAKRLLGPYAGQRARMIGCVDEIEEDIWAKHFEVRASGIVTPMASGYDLQRFVFGKDQGPALETVRPGDWIEFIGEVEFRSNFGWSLTNCEFVQRAADPRPQKPKPRRRKSAEPPKPVS